MRNFGKQLGGGEPPLTAGAAPMNAFFAGFHKCNEAAVLELTLGGAKLAGSDLPTAGEELMLDLAGKKIFGSVAWVRNGEFGVAFEEPLRARELKRLQIRQGGFPAGA